MCSSLKQSTNTQSPSAAELTEGFTRVGTVGGGSTISVGEELKDLTDAFVKCLPEAVTTKELVRFPAFEDRSIDSIVAFSGWVFVATERMHEPD